MLVFTLFHDLSNNSILRQALVYSHVNAQNQIQDWICNKIINISEKYDVVQIPRVPQGIL